MTQRTPSTMLLRMRPLFAAACFAACFAVVAASTPAYAQGGAEPGGVPEDDPFADELNPFGRGTGAKPATDQKVAPRQPAVTMPRERPSTGPSSAGPSSAGSRPGARLPVPFPETTVPGDPAERPDRSRPSMRDSRSDSWEPTPAEKLLVEAEKLDKAGKLEEARAKLREVIKLDPKMTLAYLALGVT